MDNLKGTPWPFPELYLPTTVEEVRRAEEWFAANPEGQPELPPYLRDPFALFDRLFPERKAVSMDKSATHGFVRIGSTLVNLKLVCAVNLHFNLVPGETDNVLLSFAAPDGDGMWERQFSGDEAKALRLLFESTVPDLLPLARSADQRCNRPPAGWYCTRERGHDGPCAAHQEAQGDGE